MIAAIIVEYNPLHNGHIYHIGKTKEILSTLAPNEENSLIAIMSGNFTQRGEAAVLNKYTRAKHAIMAGADLVIELPTIYATSSAEFFANGAMQVASKIKNLGLICFGAENDNISELEDIAKITTSKKYDNLIKQYLNEGLSYPVSSEKAIKNLSKIDTKTINEPNNILATEYIKQAKKLGVNAKLYAIKRVGGGYNDDTLGDNFNSAKSIRMAVKNNNLDFESLKIPQYVFDDLCNFGINYDKLFGIIASKCLELDGVYEDNEGLINRIKKYSQIANNYEQLVDLTHTKRYTKSKINRILLHIALNHTKQSLRPIGKVNVIAVSKNKKHLLSLIDFEGDEHNIQQNIYADKIYNIISNDKITDNSMIIVDVNVAKA